MHFPTLLTVAHFISAVGLTVTFLIAAFVLAPVGGIAYVLYGVTMAGVFEECGRHIVLKYIMKKNRTRENAVLYGIGHGGIEILGVILPSIITALVVAIMFTNGPLDAALYQRSVVQLWSVEVWAAFWAVVSAVIAVRLYRKMGAKIFANA